MSDTAQESRLFTPGLKIAAAGGLVIGAGCFIALAGWVNPLRGWQAYLINWIFWSAMAQGGVVVAAILDVTDSSWGRPMKRIAESFGAFLPLSFLLFVLLYPGMHYLYAWIDHPLPESEWWLSQNFLFGRDALALIVLYGVSLVYMYTSIRPDLSSDGLEGKPGGALRSFISRGWKGDDREIASSAARRRLLAPAVIIAYGFIYSLLAYDLIMSLSPTWYSTLFGAYLAVISAFGALAMLAIVTIWLRTRAGMEGEISEPQLHDLGKLIFGFCLLSVDMFWSQFLIIWYGNIPEETDFALVRAFGDTWQVVTWLVLMGTFVAPFFFLLRRGVKSDPKKLILVSFWIVLMVWLERFVLVAPSTWIGKDLPLGIVELLVTVGFGAIFFACFLYLMDRVPMLPVTDPIFTGEPAHHHVLGEPDRI